MNDQKTAKTAMATTANAIKTTTAQVTLLLFIIFSGYLNDIDITYSCAYLRSRTWKSLRNFL